MISFPSQPNHDLDRQNEGGVRISMVASVEIHQEVRTGDA